MDWETDERPADGGQPAEITAVELDERSAPRFTLLIRAAKLIVGSAERLCVIRDVSAVGISIRLFHPLPAGEGIVLELQTGDHHALTQVWQRDGEAGFQFDEAIDVERLIRNLSDFPKRELRFSAEIPVALWVGGHQKRALLRNISQRGALIECEELLAIDQRLRVEGAGLPDIEARVRWRDDRHHGLVLDTTFQLMELADIIGRLGSAQSGAVHAGGRMRSASAS